MMIFSLFSFSHLSLSLAFLLSAFWLSHLLAPSSFGSLSLSLFLFLFLLFFYFVSVVEAARSAAEHHITWSQVLNRCLEVFVLSSFFVGLSLKIF